MRIAFFTDAFLPQINGIAIFTVELAKKLADRGHKVYIFAPRFSAKETFSYPNITVRRCLSITAFIYQDYRITAPVNPFIFNEVLKNRIELIHLQTSFTVGMHGILVAKLLDLPLIGSYHTFFADPHYLKHFRLNGKWLERMVWGLMRFQYNMCDLITCPSEGVKDELVRRDFKKPIEVIPLGIDTSVFDNRKAEDVKKNYNSKGKLLLFVGRIAHEKNIPYLLECFALVVRKEPTVKLVVVGDGPQFGEVKAKVNELGLGQKVILAGKIGHEELVKSGIYGACEIFVNASTTETGPLTVLEAQANGLVCVAVKSKAMKLIRNNVNGYLVDPSDKQAFAAAVVKLLTEKSTYSRMRKATLENIRKYDQANIAGIWEKLYEDVVRKKKDS